MKYLILKGTNDIIAHALMNLRHNDVNYIILDHRGVNNHSLATIKYVTKSRKKKVHNSVQNDGNCMKFDMYVVQTYACPSLY